MQFAHAAVDLAMLRATPGGDQLSPEMLLLLVLVVYDGYEIGGSAPVLSYQQKRLEQAAALGKLGVKPDARP